MPELVKEYLLTLDDPVEGFTKEFPADVKPYKRLSVDENGKLYYLYTGTSIKDEFIKGKNLTEEEWELG